VLHSRSFIYTGKTFMNKDRIGFIGFGNMGGRMTRCIVNAGIEGIG